MVILLKKNTLLHKSLQRKARKAQKQVQRTVLSRALRSVHQQKIRMIKRLRLNCFKRNMERNDSVLSYNFKFLSIIRLIN